MKKLRLILIIVSVIALATSILVGCGDGCAPEEEKIAKVLVDKEKIELAVGEEFTLSAKTIVEGVAVEWQSTNLAVATVKNGEVTAVGVGTCVVSAHFDGESAECVVEVLAEGKTEKNGYYVDVATGTLNLTTGQKFTLNPVLRDVSGKAVDATFGYSSSDSLIAKVSSSGEIEALNRGNAKISVRYQSGDDFVTTIVSVVVEDEWSVVVDPIVGVQTESEYAISYKVYKNGMEITCDSDKVSVYTSDSSVAEVVEGKLKTTDKSGYVSLCVLLNEVNVKGIVYVAVVDPNAEAINLVLNDFAVYCGTQSAVPVLGAKWGTLKYVTDNVNFKVEDGMLYAPDETGKSTLTVVHLETNQSVTATVKAIEFDPCIRTADQLLALANYNTDEDIYLGADIDLTQRRWTTENLIYERTHTNGSVANAEIANVSYLMKKLNVNLDGRGYKIKVKYETTGTHSTIAGLFGVVDGVTVENLVYEIEVSANSGKNGASDTYPAGFAQVLRNAEIKNCFLKAKFDYVQTASDRVYMFRRFHNSSKVENCVFDISVEKGNNAVSAGGIVMENISSDDKNHCSYVTNCILLNAGNVTFSGAFYLNAKSYLNIDSLVDDWTGNTLPNKESYSRWNIVQNGSNYDINFDGQTVSSYESGRVYVSSADEFMQIGSVNGKQIVLTNNIDLTSQSWTYEENFSHAWTNANGTPATSKLTKITYLVRDLHASIDGRGYKITASYDQSNVTSHGLPAIIGAIHKGVAIENLVVDFTMTANASAKADFYGVLAINADGTTIKDCFIKGRFNFASGAAFNDLKRASVVGRTTNYTVIESCIADMQVAIGGVNQNAGNFWWTNNGNFGKLNNSTIINPVDVGVTGTGKTGVSYYSSLANFITAWSSNTLTNQEAYTAWSVENGKIKLNGKVVA